MFNKKCPLCGTFGREWHKEPEAFMCPNCSSFFSHFGLILQPENEEENDMLNVWS